MQALAHAGKPHTLPWVRSLRYANQRTSPGMRHSATGVLDGQVGNLTVVKVPPLQSYAGGWTMSVARDIGKGFLHDPEQHQFNVGQQATKVRGDVKIDGDAAALHITIDIAA